AERLPGNGQLDAAAEKRVAHARTEDVLTVVVLAIIVAVALLRGFELEPGAGRQVAPQRDRGEAARHGKAGGAAADIAGRKIKNLIEIVALEGGGRLQEFRR